MAQRPTDRERKKQLVAALEASRQSLQLDRSRIKKQVNPLFRVRSAVRKNPLPVFAGAAGAALLLTLLLRRRREEPKPFSAKRMILGWVISLAKPAARFWVANWAKDRFLPLSDPFQPPGSDHTP